MKKFWDLIKDENGMETVEWALMSSLIAFGLVGVVSSLGHNVLIRFQGLLNNVTGS